MATLDENKIKKRKQRNVKMVIILTLIELAICPLVCYIVHQFLSTDLTQWKNINIDYSYLSSLETLLSVSKVQIFYVLFQVIWIAVVVYCTSTIAPAIAKVTEMNITDDIKIPVPAGNGQHGNERFLNEKEKETAYQLFEYNGKNKPDQKGGVVVNYQKFGNTEKIYYIGGEYHSLIIGASGSGKTRREILETLCMQIMTGISVIVSDVKGELYYYTSQYAKENDYKVIAIDLRTPSKSSHYNFMQPILDSIEDGDIPQAVDYTWDLVSVLVGKIKGEAIWHNGESAAIAAAILAVALEAPPEFRNLTNVYYFLAYMCKSNEFGEMPITEYLNGLPDTHPAKGVFAMAEIAAEKTRSSFFSSALGTLKLFTNPKIAEMTSSSDFRLNEIGKEKTIVYMMIPDEKQTLYSLVSILITQQYTALVECANAYGGKLPVETDFDLDEVGNFPFIPVLGNILSAGRSRGVRANLVIQDYQQLESKYKDDFKNLKTNCQIKIYLKTDDIDTLKSFSESLGKYTVEVSSASTSLNDGKKTNMNYSSSASLTGRALLEPAELKRFKTPYALVSMTGSYSAVNQLPDISQYYFNSLLGLGDQKHNTHLIMQREAEREEHEISELNLWGVWNDIEVDTEGQNSNERVSFL